jgi:cupin fold WbuC family metalloprotein
MEGKMGIFSFNESGEVIDAVTLGAGDIYRVEVGMYHAVMPLSNQTIYHENKPGPFLGDKDSLFPGWAPTGEDQSIVDDYVSNLKLKLTK